MVGPRSSYAGPFLRLGNTFFDPEPPAFDVLPEGHLTAADYLDVSRALLADRKAGRMRHFAALPEYLSRHRNGILWRSVALLYSFSMPENAIVTLTKAFEDPVFVDRDPFVTGWIFQMLLETGIPRFLRTSARLIPLLPKDTDTGDIARQYAVFLEDVGFEPGRSALVAAEATGSREALSAAVSAALNPFDDRHASGHPIRLHSARPIEPESVLLALAEGLIRPYFYVKIYYEKVLLEAYTGFDLSSGFRKLQLDPVALHDALVRMSDSVDFAAFEPGQRYFFGTPLD